MTAPAHTSAAGKREPKALDALASIGDEIALIASYAIILIAPLVFWVAI